MIKAVGSTIRGKTYASDEIPCNSSDRKKRPFGVGVGVGVREVVARCGDPGDETEKGTADDERADSAVSDNCTCEIDQMATSCCGVKKPKLNSVVDSSSSNCCNNSNHHQRHEMMTNGLPGGSAACCANGRSAMSSSMVAMPTSELQGTKPGDGGRARVINVEMVSHGSF